MRTKMLSYNNQVATENDDSQKKEILLLRQPGRAVNNPVSYLEGPRSQLFWPMVVVPFLGPPNT